MRQGTAASQGAVHPRPEKGGPGLSPESGDSRTHGLTRPHRPDLSPRTAPLTLLLLLSEGRVPRIAVGSPGTPLSSSPLRAPAAWKAQLLPRGLPATRALGDPHPGPVPFHAVPTASLSVPLLLLNHPHSHSKLPLSWHKACSELQRLDARRVLIRGTGSQLRGAHTDCHPAVRGPAASVAAPASHTHTCSTPQSGVETVPPKPTGPSACVAPGTHVHRSNWSHEKPKPHPQVGRLRGDRVLGQGTRSVPSLDMHVIPQVHLSPRSPRCSPEEPDLVTTAQDPRRGESGGAMGRALWAPRVTSTQQAPRPTRNTTRRHL